MVTGLSTGNDDDGIEIIGGLDPRIMAVRDAAKDEDSDERSLTDLVEQPAKVMRIGTMIKQLLEEVRAAPLDEASRNRLREIHATSIRELEQGLRAERVADLGAIDRDPGDAFGDVVQHGLIDHRGRPPVQFC